MATIRQWVYIQTSCHALYNYYWKKTLWYCIHVDSHSQSPSGRQCQIHTFITLKVVVLLAMKTSTNSYTVCSDCNVHCRVCSFDILIHELLMELWAYCVINEVLVLCKGNSTYYMSQQLLCPALIARPLTTYMCYSLCGKLQYTQATYYNMYRPIYRIWSLPLTLAQPWHNSWTPRHHPTSSWPWNYPSADSARGFPSSGSRFWSVLLPPYALPPKEGITAQGAS